MAKDNRVIDSVEDIEALGNEYNVNAYTIKYDSKVKRFFKGFAPKVGSGAAISGVIFAGLGVATVATAGIASAGLIAAAGTSVALGAGIQSIYNGIVYHKNSAKSRFKSLGVGGKEDNAGTIGVIEHCEELARKYTQELKNYPSKKSFTLEDGAKYSRHDLEKRIKEREDIVYHGLKYLLQQGIEASEEINALRLKINLTQREEERLENYWDMMRRIGGCVEYLAIGRREFNPYKGLIIDAINKGCLLGNDYQNNEIRSVSNIKDKSEAEKLYSIMYEQRILHDIKKERKQALERQEALSQKYENTTKTQREIIATDGQIDKVSRKNRKLAQEINENNLNDVLIKITNSVIVELPQPMNSFRKKLVKARDEFKQAVLAKDENEIKPKKEALEILLGDVKDRISKFHHATGKMEGLEQFEQQFEEYKAESEQALSRQTKKYEGAVQRGWNQRKENRQLKKDYEKDLDQAQQGWNEAEVRAKEAEKQATKAKKQAAKAISQVKNARAERDYWQGRTESSEDTVTVLYDNLTETEHNLRVTKGDLRSARRRLAESGKKTGLLSRMIESLLLRDKANEDTLESLQEEVEYVQGVASEQHKGNVETKKELEATKKFVAKQQKRISKLEKENKELKQQNEEFLEDAVAEIDSLKQQNTTLEEERRQAQTELAHSKRQVELTETFLEDADRQNKTSEKKRKDAKRELRKANEKLAQQQATIEELSGKANYERQARDRAEIEQKAKTQKSGKKVARIIADRDEKYKGLEQEYFKVVDAHSELETANIENFNRRIEAEVDNEILTAELAETNQLKQNLENELSYMAKELEGITGERNAYKKETEELVAEINLTKKQVEELEDEMADVRLLTETRNYNRDYQNAFRHLDRLLIKAELHARMTINERGNDECANFILDSVLSARKQNLEGKTIDALNEMKSTFSTIYESNKVGLVSIGQKKLNKIVTDFIENKKAKEKTDGRKQ